MILRNAVLEFEIEIYASLITSVLRCIVYMIQMNFIFTKVIIESVQVSIIHVSPYWVRIYSTTKRIGSRSKPSISHPTFFFKGPISRS